MIIAVNAWTNSDPDSTLMNEIYYNHLFLPFFYSDNRTLKGDLNEILSSSSSTPEIKQFTVGRVFIQELLKNLDERDFVKKIYQTRYQPLLGDTRKEDSDQNLCKTSQVLLDSYGAKIVEHLKPSLEKVTQTFQQIKVKGVKELQLANYLEDVIAAVGGIDQVHSLIKSCFQ